MVGVKGQGGRGWYFEARVSLRLKLTIVAQLLLHGSKASSGILCTAQGLHVLFT